MIQQLENSNLDVAKQIFNVFQNAYKIEAQLIGVVNFPPLSRSIKDIENSKTFFYGFSENGSLGAIIEIAIKDRRLEIDSLTVDPQYFRRGMAGQLIGYVLAIFEFTEARVETAIVNEPAIHLYRKYGFTEFKRWTPSHGIPKIAMSLKRKM
ncbi:N-acetyltransferase [uncultured Paraglaciecola sp.]|uniref:GNAT family N-acetyltransferase n=1 Tax=uncultured Paraglaciecola sp. TaxID=1765024 RepID=UPI0030DD670C|tara:strand:- start:66808 stop:67263 length:456 start_codon:yes stop_codon:yes gene_type:complete